MSAIIPEGYKQTKVGIVPVDWRECEVASFIIEKKHYCNDDTIPLYSLTIEEGVVPKSKRYERSHLVKDDEDAYKSVEFRDFVYNPMNLRFGALAVHTEHKVVKVSQYYDIFGIKDAIINLSYVYAYLKSERIMFFYNRMATGSLEEKKRVHFKEFKNFKFPFPPLEEQEKIAEILTTWDEAISKQEELIKAKEEQKKALMQKLLSGEVRFDGFGDEWEDIRLGKYIKEISQKNKENVELVLSVTNKHGFIAQKDYFDKEVASKDTTNYKVAKKGNFAYNPSRINVGSIGLLEEYEIGILSPMYVIFECLKGLDKQYLNYWISTHNFTGNLYRFLSGSVRDSLAFNDMKLMKIKLPSFPEQQKIAEVLSLSDHEINLLKNELEGLKLQKKGLMQKLLTGQVRVRV